MNDIIQRQHIQKRSRPFRPSAGMKRFVPKRRRASAVPRSPLPGLGTAFFRTAAVVRLRSRLSPGLVAAVLASALVAGAGSVFIGIFAAQFSVRSLSAEADPLFQRDLRAYAGLPTVSRSGDDAELAPLMLSETFRFERYTVRPGDSLSSIASRHSLNVGSVIASNGVSNARRLRAGAVLKIPNMDGLPYTVRRGDSLSRIAASYGIPMEAILDANDLGTDAIHPGMSLFLPGARLSGEELRSVLGDRFIYPVRGRLTSGYGWRGDPFTGVRRFHAAIDLAAPTGTPLYAAMDGRVSSLGYSSVYGKYLILSHAGGYQTMYAHLNEYRTEKGARVSQGARIGDVGNTGYSTGSHLHFAVFKNGRALNPLTLLPAR